MARARAKMAKAKTERARERARARKERHPLSLLPRALAPWSSLPAKRPPLQILMRNKSSERLMENILLHDHSHSQSGSGLRLMCTTLLLVLFFVAARCFSGDRADSGTAIESSFVDASSCLQ